MFSMFILVSVRCHADARVFFFLLSKQGLMVTNTVNNIFVYFLFTFICIDFYGSNCFKNCV